MQIPVRAMQALLLYPIRDDGEEVRWQVARWLITHCPGGLYADALDALTRALSHLWLALEKLDCDQDRAQVLFDALCDESELDAEGPCAFLSDPDDAAAAYLLASDIAEEPGGWVLFVFARALGLQALRQQ